MATSCACKGDDPGACAIQWTPNDDHSRKCSKCGENDAIVNSRGKTCKECFLKLVSRIFRSNLRTKCLAKGESRRNLIILGDGGINTIALLHMLLSRNNDRDIKVAPESPGRPADCRSKACECSVMRSMNAPTKGRNDGSIGMNGSSRVRMNVPLDAHSGHHSEDPSFYKLVNSDDLSLASIVHVNMLREDLSEVAKGFVSAISSTFSSLLGKGVEPEKVLENEHIVEYLILGVVKVTCLGAGYFLMNGQRPECGEWNGDCMEILCSRDGCCGDALRGVGVGAEGEMDGSVGSTADHLEHVHKTPDSLDDSQCDRNDGHNDHPSAHSAHPLESTGSLDGRLGIPSCFAYSLRSSHYSDRDGYMYISNILRTRNILAYLSRVTGVVYLMTPETQDDVCKNVLFMTCTGNGGLVACKTAFVDTHTLNGCGTIVRPLKSLSNKEVAFYHRLNGCPEWNDGPNGEPLGGMNDSTEGRMDVPLDAHYGHYDHSLEKRIPSIVECVGDFTTYINSIHLNTLHNITNVTNKLVHVLEDKSRCRVCRENISEDGTLCDVCRFFYERNASLGGIFDLLARF